MFLCWWSAVTSIPPLGFNPASMVDVEPSPYCANSCVCCCFWMICSAMRPPLRVDEPRGASQTFKTITLKKRKWKRSIHCIYRCLFCFGRYTLYMTTGRHRTLSVVFSLLCRQGVASKKIELRKNEEYFGVFPWQWNITDMNLFDRLLIQSRFLYSSGILLARLSCATVSRTTMSAALSASELFIIL